MMVISFRIDMTPCATESGVIPGIRMAIRTLAPLPFMLAAVDGEILPVMVKLGWAPGIFRVA